MGSRAVLVTDERGAVFAEYAVVLICVSLIVALAVGALGIPLFNLYAFAEAMIGLPIP
jgi:Flp pilus assembly pilin Flp